jgi:formate-dependent nitrite reductase membrane component NrfD
MDLRRPARVVIPIQAPSPTSAWSWWIRRLLLLLVVVVVVVVVVLDDLTI